MPNPPRSPAVARARPAMVLALCLGGAGLCAAADRYVSPTGDDANSGTRTAPWRTIQAACDKLRPGDTAHVAAGVYREKPRLRVSGSADGGWVTLRGDGEAVISGEGVEGAHLLEISDRSWVRVIGFELRGLEDARDGSAIRISGHGAHIEIRDNHIHDIRGRDAMAITVLGRSATRPIAHLVIDGNRIHDCEPAKSETVALNGNIEDFAVTNNHIRDVNNIGIDIIGGEDWVCPDTNKVPRDGVCRGNRVERARANYGGGYAAGIYVDGARDIVIEDNVVTGCDIGIEVGAENEGAVARGIVVRRNTVFGNDKAGIAFGGYDASAGRVRDCQFTDNICYHNATDPEDGQGELWIQLASGCAVTGNTFCTRAGSFLVQCARGSSRITLDRNVWYSGDGAEGAMTLWRGRELEGWENYRKVSGQDANSSFRPPKFRDPDNGDFRRQASAESAR